MGVRFFLLASLLGLGAATLASWALRISAIAVRILLLMASWFSGMLTSLSKGMASSFPPGLCSHSLTRLISMSSKTAVGLLFWIGGMGPGEYLSIGLRVGCLPVVSFSVSSSSRCAEIEEVGGRARVFVWVSVAGSLLVWVSVSFSACLA